MGLWEVSGGRSIDGWIFVCLVVSLCNRIASTNSIKNRDILQKTIEWWMIIHKFYFFNTKKETYTFNQRASPLRSSWRARWCWACWRGPWGLFRGGDWIKGSVFIGFQFDCFAALETGIQKRHSGLLLWCCFFNPLKIKGRAARKNPKEKRKINFVKFLKSKLCFECHVTSVKGSICAQTWMNRRLAVSFSEEALRVPLLGNNKSNWLDLILLGSSLYRRGMDRK